LFRAVRQVGAEGIVSKRRSSAYRGGASRDWLKTKCHQVGQFVAIGFVELDGGRVEALHVAELHDGELVPAGVVKFGLRGLWPALDQVRAEQAHGTVPLQIPLKATVKYFGRSGRYIRDAVLLDLTAG